MAQPEYLNFAAGTTYHNITSIENYEVTEDNLVKVKRAITVLEVAEKSNLFRMQKQAFPISYKSSETISAYISEDSRLLLTNLSVINRLKTVLQSCVVDFNTQAKNSEQQVNSVNSTGDKTPGCS